MDRNALSAPSLSIILNSDAHCALAIPYDFMWSSNLISSFSIFWSPQIGGRVGGQIYLLSVSAATRILVYWFCLVTCCSYYVICSCCCVICFCCSVSCCCITWSWVIIIGSFIGWAIGAVCGICLYLGCS